MGDGLLQFAPAATASAMSKECSTQIRAKWQATGEKYNGIQQMERNELMHANKGGVIKFQHIGKEAHQQLINGLCC